MTDKLIEKLQNITGVSFVSVTYTNQHNEKQKTVFNVGVNYDKAKQKDLEYLKSLDISSLETDLPNELLVEATQSLINDFEKTINKEKIKINNFIPISNGLKLHNETNELYVYGMQIHKTVLEEGEYKEVKSKPITVAKNLIRKKLRTSKYRQYKIGKAEQFKISGDTIVFGEEI
jgi:hypothetical protein